jgi:hypothetical protein
MTVLDRSAPVDGGQRALQQAILRGFATTGAAPPPYQLAEDYLALDRAGRIRPRTTASRTRLPADRGSPP